MDNVNINNKQTNAEKKFSFGVLQSVAPYNTHAFNLNHIVVQLQHHHKIRAEVGVLW